MVGPPPLTGLRVLEFAGLAPGPYAGLLLADAGASVLRIDRPAAAAEAAPAPADLLTRRKTSIAVDIKSAGGQGLVRALARHADVLIDPFRPGVLEKVGLGPAALCAANPRLVYARLTGFRREAGEDSTDPAGARDSGKGRGRGSRYAAMAGHDINYLAVSGVLSQLGRAGSPPTPPANLLADFAGGGASLFQGVLLALLARATTGRGQVVEANMVDGARHVATFARLARRSSSSQAAAQPFGPGPRGTNLLDSGCPFYDTYATRDAGRFMAVGALEPRFFAQLVRGLGLEGAAGWEARQYDRAAWPAMRRAFEAAFRGRTRAEWEAVFDGTDACCTPVLDHDELAADPAREGDQRPPYTLRETPCLAIRRVGGADDDDVSRGQGPGVEGDGYEGSVLAPGQGGEETLKEWLSWRKGKEFDEREGGGLVLLTGKSKL